MAKSRRRYITVENSFFERQPRIARHPTGDRNEDEKPRNLGVQSPPPLILSYPSGARDRRATFRNLLEQTFPEIHIRRSSLETFLSHPLSCLSRIFVSSFLSSGVTLRPCPRQLLLDWFKQPTTFFFISPLYCNFRFFWWNFSRLCTCVHLHGNFFQFFVLYIYWKVSECRSDLTSN